MSASHAPNAEGGLGHDDPRVAIRWPLPVTVLSDRDRQWPLLTTDAPRLL